MEFKSLAFLRVSAWLWLYAFTITPPSPPLPSPPLPSPPLPSPPLPSQEACCGVQSLTDWYAVDFPGKNESFPNSVPVSCCDLSKWSLSSPCTGVDVTTAEVKQQKYFSQVEMGGKGGGGGQGRGGEGECMVVCDTVCCPVYLLLPAD